MTLPATTPLPEHVRRFLSEPRYAAVATTDADGAPRQAVVWFLFEEDELILNSLVGRRWPANLRRDPRVSIAITAADEESWVGLTGVVQIIDDQPQAHADIAAMARRYNANAPAEAERLIRDKFSTQRRVSFRLRPSGIHDHIEGD